MPPPNADATNTDPSKDARPRAHSLEDPSQSSHSRTVDERAGGCGRTVKHVAVLSLNPLYVARIEQHLDTLADAGVDAVYINWSAWEADGPAAVDGRVIEQDACGQGWRLVRKRANPAFGLNVLRYAGMLAWFIGQCARARDRVQVWHLHDLLLLPLIPVLNLLTRGRVVFESHEHFPRWPGVMGIYARVMYRWCLPFADGVVGVSASTVPCARKPAAVVPNYQSRRAYQRAGEARMASADELARRGDGADGGGSVQVVYFGSLWTLDRDVRLLIDAATLTLERSERVCWKVGGTLRGPGASTFERELEQLAEKYGPRFQWFGVMPRRRVIEQTVGADIGLLLIRDDVNLRGTSANKVYEYLQAGIVLLGTQGFDITEQLRRADAAVLYPVGVDAQQVADDIIALENDRGRLSRMKAAAEALGVTYCWEAAADRYLSLYEKLVGG